MLKPVSCLLILFTLFGASRTMAQQDSAKQKKNTNLFSKPDPGKAYNPRIAMYRSAILPGWGQATNKKYWKIPVVYAALGTTTYIFFRNVKQYREARDAYLNAIDGYPGNDFEIPQPYYSVKDQPERIKNFRNQVRQNVDYTVLFFILFWGLNVVDATVDAHLKTFDVSDDLSLRIRAGYSELAQTNGISLVLNIGKNRSK
ncbi:MAG TPA: DUF5683 domain-containing protein [Ferruginibacter sp.]|nr:DUF5683 domain-containing protein [Ferruginibacter sp.]